MICPYSFDEPIGSGIASLLDGRYWCMGWIEFGMSARRRRCPEDCPFDMGEWGAWRAVVGHYIHPVIAEWDVCAIRYQDEPTLYPILSDSEAFEAVGWSP